MPKIMLHFLVNAPAQRCFDLSRSIDLHLISTAKTDEKAIAGVTSGLIGLNQTVTWRAKHFGVWQTLISKITAFDPPNSFTDEMVSGAFKAFKHQHIFKEMPAGTLMTDVFEYVSPLGVLGRLADFLFLKRYMTKLLIERNRIIKEYAETEQWKAILKAEC